MGLKSVLSGAIGTVRSVGGSIFGGGVDIVQSAGGRVRDIFDRGSGADVDVWDLPGPLQGPPSPGSGTVEPTDDPSILGRVTRGAGDLVRGVGGALESGAESILDVFESLGLGQTPILPDEKGPHRDMGAERPESSQGSRRSTQQPGQNPRGSRRTRGQQASTAGPGFLSGMGTKLGIGALGLVAVGLGFLLLRRTS